MTAQVAFAAAAKQAGRLASGLTALGVSAPEDVLDRLDAYLGLLKRWARVYDLTAARSRGELVTRHVLDSAAVLPLLPAGPKLDAGSGAGLPGLVLAILQPSTPWVLLDSAARKVAFLRHASAELDLDNVHIVRERLERYDPGKPPGDVVARALAPLPRLVELNAGLLRRGSRLIAMLGRRPSEAQLKALPGVVCRSCRQVHVPGLDAQRHVAVFSGSPDAAGPGAAS